MSENKVLVWALGVGAILILVLILLLGVGIVAVMRTGALQQSTAPVATLDFEVKSTQVFQTVVAVNFPSDSVSLNRAHPVP